MTSTEMETQAQHAAAAAYFSVGLDAAWALHEAASIWLAISRWSFFYSETLVKRF